MKDLLKSGLSKPIDENDVYSCCKSHKSEKISIKFKKYWENELNKMKPNLLNVIMKLYGLKILLLGLCYATLEITSKWVTLDSFLKSLKQISFYRILQPLILGYLILYFMDNPHKHTETDAYLFATGVVLTTLLPIIIFHPFIFFVFQCAMKVRVACCSLIYEKVISLIWCFLRVLMW